jgi:hypothetical protein
MVAYEFYWHDKTEGHKLIGILPERRKNPERINDESIMNWGRQVVGNDVEGHSNIYYIQIEV